MVLFFTQGFSLKLFGLLLKQLTKCLVDEMAKHRKKFNLATCHLQVDKIMRQPLLFSVSLSVENVWRRHDTRNNNIEHNDTLLNGIDHSQQSFIQHSDNQHSGLSWTMSTTFILYSTIPSLLFFQNVVMLNVIILIAVALCWKVIIPNVKLNTSLANKHLSCP